MKLPREIASHLYFVFFWLFEILKMEMLYVSTTGLDPDDTDDEDDSDNVQKKGSVLDNLNSRFEDEKEALLARLRGTSRRF